ncbi:hypothetical protein WA026_009738 [Henosepilachna vigintioctopunctata]|uniref:Attacin C-terminal domain-containing protein n=1 Tax=Henosepilachna vigintioctopunctata TaxID=420089 RepID=A0AAW1TIY1_9CUCU
MKTIVSLLGALCLIAIVQGYYVAEDEFGENYVMVPLPLSRQRRQTSVGIGRGMGGGTQVTLGHQGTIFQNDKHLVTGGGFASKQFRPVGPTTVGGNLGYQHIPSGSGINIGAQNTRHFGTDLQATGNVNLWRQGNSRLDASGSYGRHYGGPWGTGRPNWGVGLNFNHRF